jgi:hypothetical protein
MQSAGSWRLKAGSLAVTVADFLSFEPQASCLKLIYALADGLRRCFSIAVPIKKKLKQPEGTVERKSQHDHRQQEHEHELLGRKVRHL